MSLNDNDRKTMVRLEMEKALHFLQQADDNKDRKEFDIAANRYYYACFHAVHALFIYNRLTSHKHKGLLRVFGLHFVLPGVLPEHLGAFMTRMEQLREKADYNCACSIGESELVRQVAPAHELVSAVQQLLQQPPTVKI